MSLTLTVLFQVSHGKWQALKWYMRSNHDVILVLCFPSIFKLIIWKQAAVHFWSWTFWLEAVTLYAFLACSIQHQWHAAWPLTPDSTKSNSSTDLSYSAISLLHRDTYPVPSLKICPVSSFLPYPLLLRNLFGCNISVLPFVPLLLFLQTLHYTIIPYVCAAHKEVSLESADANYKFNLHFN